MAAVTGMIYIPLWKRLTVVGIVLVGCLFAAPNLLPSGARNFLVDQLGMRQVNLGLDLRGGSHMLLEVVFQVVIDDKLEGLEETLRNEIREVGRSRGERIGYKDLKSQGRSVSITARDDAQQALLSEIIQRIVQENSVITNPLIFTAGNTPEIEVTQEGSKFTLTYTDQALSQWRTQVISQSIEIVRRRIDELGTLEPDIQRQGLERILVQVPGLSDPQRLKALLGTTAKLTFQMVEDAHFADSRPNRPPPGMEILPVETSEPQSVAYYTVRRRAPVSGDCLDGAQQAFYQGAPVVNFRFNPRCARLFGDLTQNNVGRQFAIILDDKVISAPTIREPILGGSGQISGGFMVQEANDLALLLRAGALPAPLTIEEERTVGPGLGADSIAAGQIACVIGMVLVVLFMLLAYGLFGLFANVALILNLVLILGSLSLLQATLTLPGIAGIVLTIGMAVDANVLIFERIREELANKRSIISAIDVGYSRALSTILDSNMTTLIATFMLLYFGSGPIRGFAITLSIGIITSMFSAIMLTRLMILFWLRNSKRTRMPI